MSYLYAIGTDDAGMPIKLGTSGRPKNRLVQMQTGSPAMLKILALWVFGSDAEAARTEMIVHMAFAPKCSHYEWFWTTTDEVDEFMRRDCGKDMRAFGMQGYNGARLEWSRAEAPTISPGEKEIHANPTLRKIAKIAPPLAARIMEMKASR